MNVGSGPHHINGWREFDISPNIFLSKFRIVKILLDKLKLIDLGQKQDWDKKISWGKANKLPFSNDEIDFIYASHVLEHVYLTEAKDILNHFYYKLKAGGRLRICSPDYDALVNQYCAARKIDPIQAAAKFEHDLLAYGDTRPSKVEMFRSVFGSHVHYWHPTLPVMLSLLKEAGFTNIVIDNFQSGDFPDLNLVENRNLDSFYVTAEKHLAR